MPRAGEAQFHQRDETLTAREQLGVVTKLGKHGDRFLQRAGAVIVKSSRIHRSVILAPWASVVKNVQDRRLSLTKQLTSLISSRLLTSESHGHRRQRCDHKGGTQNRQCRRKPPAMARGLQDYP